MRSYRSFQYHLPGCFLLTIRHLSSLFGRAAALGIEPCGTAYPQAFAASAIYGLEDKLTPAPLRWLWASRSMKDTFGCFIMNINFKIVNIFLPNGLLNIKLISIRKFGQVFTFICLVRVYPINRLRRICLKFGTTLSVAWRWHRIFRIPE